MSTNNPNIKILAEIYMPINYCLLSRTTEFYSITGIIAPPEGLAKCRQFIKNDMPFNINIVEAPSYPEAAKYLQNYNLTYSSIGTQKTAEINAKDEKYQRKLNLLDTEHNAIQTEYESVKSAIDKNISRSFKAFQG